MRELLAAARQLYGSKKGELETLTMRFANGEISLPGDANGEGADGADGAEGEGAAGDAAEGVGTDDREKSLGLAIGRAPDGAKPTGGGRCSLARFTSDMTSNCRGAPPASAGAGSAAAAATEAARWEDVRAMGVAAPRELGLCAWAEAAEAAV